MACPIPRKYPPKQPPSWKPPVPRWQLTFPSTINAVHTLYIGIQSHTSPNPALSSALASLTTWLAHTARPASIDAFLTETTLAHDLPHSRVWVLYFTSPTVFTAALATLDLPARHRAAGPTVGFWAESFSTPISRLETNYAGLHERPGLARLSEVGREGHELSAYWGAARDRIPASGEDLFALPGSKVPEPDGRNGDGEELREARGKGEKAKTTWHVTDELSTESDAVEVQILRETEVPRGYGQRLVGGNYDNMTHIRSGQCWDQCPEDEAEAYTRPGGLQEKLMKGMEYLWTHPEETGTLGLRWLRNVVSDENKKPEGEARADGTSVRPINETCGAGFFRNLKDLENWSSTHPSHMAIFTGAHKHAREWGSDRKFMTWHEVSVLKRGEARWEYVNCDPRTGVVRYVKMDSVEDLSAKQ
ncbi:uncharacterized protein HMPREF1541_11053 [Cyphellophora europaea CBS 101466]|uniref:Phenylacetaldoxime dehydratase n=1 Tax=Cyphellophora europaea (strain CBS 101466) TaxID=1220924 RepID=W2S5H4_CYPE1|nr:uncharacterized protein HMPREF1541_11053 [Cyphellophora europaea CBS 101466]ETN43922.1 hypothetical protein HMPREF1541_11053 [Cyphellophora europaea CBS 101466]